MKLFKYELKKNVLRISVFILLLALIGVNLFKQHETARFLGDSRIAIGVEDKSSLGRKMYEEYKGELTPEKFEALGEYRDYLKAYISSDEYKPTEETDERFYTGYAMGDLNFSEETADKMRYAYLYPNQMIELKQRADENIEFYTGRSDFEVRKNELVKQLYTGRRISEYGNYEAFRLYFDYEFSSLVIIVMIIFAFAASLSDEKSTGTDRIIRSCRRAKSVFLTKQAVMLIFVAVLIILFAVMDIVRFSSFYDGSFINQPLYAIEEYRYTPLNVTVFGAVMLSLLGKLLALVFIGEIVLLISSFTKNAGLAITLCFAAVGALIIINEHINPLYSPLSLLNAESWMKDFNCVDICGYPVLSFIVQFVITAALIAVLTVICYFRAGYIRKEKGAVQ